MATLALFAAGSAIGPTLFGGATAFTIGSVAVGSAALGGAIGGLAGSLIDGMFLFPALAPAQNIKGPRIDDMPVQTASEGSPIKRCFGPLNRIAGTIIWLGELQEKKIEDEQGKGGGGGTATSYKYSVNVAIGVCEGPINRIVKIWANEKLLYNADAATEGEEITVKVGDIQIYLGTPDQAVNGVMQVSEGSESMPAYRGIAYVFLNTLQLADFGNALPRFTFLVEEAQAKPLRYVISDILVYAGIAEDQFDVSRLSQCVRGYVLSGPQSAVRSIEPLMQVYDLLTQEVDGKLVFFTRGQESQIAIPDVDLAAHTSGSSVSRPVRLSDVAGFDLPSEVNVTHIDPEIDLQQGSQRELRLDRPTDVVENVDAPMTLSADEAREYAARRLWRPWAERISGKLTLPPKYVHLSEGDLVSFNFKGEEYLMEIDQVDRGNDHLVLVSGVMRETQTLTHSGPWDASEGFVPDAEPKQRVDIALMIMNIPALRDSDTQTPGYYYAVASLEPEEEWTGAVLFDSLDNSNWSTVFPITPQAQVLLAKSVLPTGKSGYWDNASTVDVEVLAGTLSSKTDLEVLNGANTILLGNEILSFCDATLIGTRQYRLSRLLRGLRNTEASMPLHQVNERGVLFSSGTVGFKDYALASIGTTRYFRAVSFNALVDDADETLTRSLGAATIKPFSPAHLKGSRIGTTDLTITWQLRSRAIVRAFSIVQAPVLEPFERYQIEIRNTAGGTVLRTIEVDEARTVTYTTAQQTADGVTPGATVHVTIYQISDVIGRGNKTEAYL